MFARQKCLFAFAATLLLFNHVSTTMAADTAKQASVGKQRWVSIFPIGIEVHTLAFDSSDANLIYASTYKGLFKSVDGGKMWTPLRIFESAEKIKWSIVKIDPTDAKTLYLSVSRDGGSGNLWRSRDKGIRWEDISAGVIRKAINGISINSKSSQIIYVASEDGLYKTRNGGKTWGKLAKEAYSVFLNPMQPDEVYASFKQYKYGFGYAGLHHSTNGGQSFELIEPSYTATEKTFLGDETREHKCESVYYASINPHDNQKIYLDCDYGGGWYDFLKSADAGQSWQSLWKQKKLFGGMVRTWSFHPREEKTMYIGVQGYEISISGRKASDEIFKSIDGGATWSPLSAPPALNISDIEITSSNVMYATTSSGIYRTSDEGETWEPASIGLPAHINNNHLLFADNKSAIYVGNDNGYWISQDKATSWNWSDAGKLHQIIVTNDQTTYVTREEEQGYLHVDRLMPDNAQTEIKIEGYPNYLAVSLSNSQVLYVTAAEGADDRDAKFIFKSEDGGFSWSELDWFKWLKMNQKDNYQHNIVSLTVDYRSPDIVYGVVVHSRLGFGKEPMRHVSLIKTTDGGKTWTDISQGLNPSVKEITKKGGTSALLLSIDPSNSSIVYLSEGKGIYRSNDGGKTWKSKFLASKNIVFNDISIDPANPKTIYLASTNGVYKSANGGETWQSLNSGLFGSNVIKIIASSSMVLVEGENGIYRLY